MFRKSKLSATFILGWLLLSPLVFSQDEPVAEIFVDDVLQAAAPNQQDLLQLEAKLRDLEGRVDAYDVSIGELSLELGNFYASIGDSESAQEAFRRALHVNRINYGLNSSSQLPVLEAMHRVFFMQQDFIEAGHMLDRILAVYKKNYGQWDPPLADIYERIGLWHLAVYHFRLDDRPLTHLLAANTALTNTRQIDQYQGVTGYDFDLYNLMAYTNHGLSVYLRDPRSNSRDIEEAARTQENASSAISSSYRRGKSLLEEGLMEAMESGDLENIVNSQLMHADWEQLFGRRHSARAGYINAYEIAQELDEQHPVREIFNLPHPLPNFDVRALGYGPRGAENIDVELSYDVSEWGQASNVELWEAQEGAMDENTEQSAEEDVSEIEYSGEERAAHRTASRMARSTIYRPAIINGQPMDFEGVRQTIVINTN